MIRHKSIAHVNGEVTPALRFVLRQAVACYDKRVHYGVEWREADWRGVVLCPYVKNWNDLHHEQARVLPPQYGFAAVLTICAEKIPPAKPISGWRKPSTTPVWRPKLSEAVWLPCAYKWITNNSVLTWHPGFVIEHPCGLRLVKNSPTDELVQDGESFDEGWMIIHKNTGVSMGLIWKSPRAVAVFRELAVLDWNFEGLDGRTEAHKELARKLLTTKSGGRRR